ncbi:hypothetical protein [Acrocarpospora sp. B8E8]|uniref:hypothetical protein n=1 Tax=Acrocarpospora sp. B8E8 TaxID=3153572 RepID=UPI00325D6C2F
MTPVRVGRFFAPGVLGYLRLGLRRVGLEPDHPAAVHLVVAPVVGEPIDQL